MAVLPEAITNQLVANLIPERIAKSIDAAERADRVALGRSLSGQAASATDPVLRRAFKLKAQAVLNAQPRATTEREHAQLIRKAAAAPSAVQAERIRAQARELVEELHPMAPRGTAQAAAIAKAAGQTAVRRVTAKPKTATGKPVLVYDSRLRPLGVVGRHAIKKAASGERTPMQAVFDQDGNLIGVVDPAQIQPVAGSAARQGAQAQGQATQAGQPAPTGQAAPAQSAAVAKMVARAAGRAPRLVPATDRAAAVFLQGWRDAAAKNRQTARRTGRR